MMATPTRASWLQPFKVAPEGEENIRCPKCLSDDLHWEWHKTVVFGAHCENAFGDALVESNATVSVADAIATMDTEHLCRGCLACHHTWCEETADA